MLSLHTSEVIAKLPLGSQAQLFALLRRRLNSGTVPSASNSFSLKQIEQLSARLTTSPTR